MVLPDPFADPLSLGDMLLSQIDEGRFRKIQLRRFAGPSAYASAMDPLRIAHLTDLHIGRVTPMRIHQEAVAITNAAKPDFVFITGVFVVPT